LQGYYCIERLYLFFHHYRYCPNCVLYFHEWFAETLGTALIFQCTVARTFSQLVYPLPDEACLLASLLCRMYSAVVTRCVKYGQASYQWRMCGHNKWIQELSSQLGTESSMWTFQHWQLRATYDTIGLTKYTWWLVCCVLVCVR
jgi:hypothetical protein